MTTGHEPSASSVSRLETRHIELRFIQASRKHLSMILGASNGKQLILSEGNTRLDLSCIPPISSASVYWTGDFFHPELESENGHGGRLILGYDWGCICMSCHGGCTDPGFRGISVKSFVQESAKPRSTSSHDPITDALIHCNQTFNPRSGPRDVRHSVLGWRRNNALTKCGGGGVARFCSRLQQVFGGSREG